MTSSQHSLDGQPAVLPLRPELEQALGSLMVHLDDELLRYRRQMRGQAPIPSRRVRPPQAHAPLDLIAVPAQTVPAEAGASDQPKPSPSRAGRPLPPPPPPNPFLKKPAPAALLAEDLTAEGRPLPAVGAPMAVSQDEVSPTKDLAAAAVTNTKVLNDLEAVEAQAADGADVVPDDVAATTAVPSTAHAIAADAAPDLALQQTQTNPDGYLESSEALLKSLADEAKLPLTDPAERPPTPYNPNARQSSLSYKLAALLLLLTASVGVGYAMINPAVLDPIRSLLTARFSASEPEAVSTTPESANPDQSLAVAGAGQNDFVPPGPDLSAREFVDLDLSRLSTLEIDQAASGSAPPVTLGTLPTPTDSATTPSVAGATSAAGQPSTTPTPTTQPAASNPATGEAATTPSAADAATATTPAPTPAATGSNYYVVMGFTGDASLTKAREVVSDAFVRNFNDGAYIQVAAFDNQASAQAQITALQQRGLTVQLYGPTDE